MIEETIQMLEAKIVEVQKKIALASSPKKPVTHRTEQARENQNPRLADLNAQIAQVHKVAAGQKLKMEALRKKIGELEEQNGKRDIITIRNEVKSMDSELETLRLKKRTLDAISLDQTVAKAI